MSTTTQKRTHRQALMDAEAFQYMFGGCYERWEIAGSVRRQKPEVGDIEHVVIPKFGEVAKGGGLFAERVTVNLVWHRLEEMIEQKKAAKHLYTINRADGSSSITPKWGELYRGVDFLGFNNEIFIATPDNWGAILTIRTGPAEFSKRLVTQCQRYGYRQEGGQMHNASGEVVRVPTEEEFFRVCGERYTDPEHRR